MKTALLLSAFLGWGILGWLAESANPFAGFLLGMAVGVGAMMWKGK